jgi:L-ascorbate metabolism protein UlaG (beta-lactamase superfamily)
MIKSLTEVSQEYREESKMSSKIGVSPIGCPTAIIEISGLRLLTDPTLDPPGEHPYGRQRQLRKTEPAALTPDDVGRIDAVLMAHEQHPAPSCPTFSATRT